MWCKTDHRRHRAEVVLVVVPVEVVDQDHKLFILTANQSDRITRRVLHPRNRRQLRPIKLKPRRHQVEVADQFLRLRVDRLRVVPVLVSNHRLRSRGQRRRRLSLHLQRLRLLFPRWRLQRLQRRFLHLQQFHRMHPGRRLCRRRMQRRW